MLPQNKVQYLIDRHIQLENELSSGEIDKKKYAEVSKEYSDLNDIVKHAKDQETKFQVCGLTGCCTLLLVGCMAKTLHFGGGIGLAKGDIEI